MAYNDDPFATPGTKKQSFKWNYTKPNEPDYTEQVTGDIVEIRQIQTKNHQTGKYEFWDDGNPKLSMLLVIDSDQIGGEFPFVFVPKGACADAVRAGMRAVGIPDSTWANLRAKNVTIMTNNQGAPYGSGRPRPWNFSVNGESSKEFRGCFKFEPPKQQPQVQQGYQQAPQGYQQMQPQGYQMSGQPVQQQFSNPQLQHAFNNASQAVHNAQFQTPNNPGYQQSQQYQQLNQAAQQGQMFAQNGNDWGNQDYYSDEVPF